MVLQQWRMFRAQNRNKVVNMKRFLLLIVMASVINLTGCKSASQSEECVYTLRNEAGMTVVVTNFGARIMSVNLPDKDGVVRDVVLGFDNVESYHPELNDNNFGACIGRYGNRIANGRIVLDSVVYELPQNNFGHCLHGGPSGWHYKLFSVVDADEQHIRMKIDSPDGDNNFPGNVTAFVTYTLTSDNRIDIQYEATTDAVTVINMTNHSYFNLSGNPAAHSVVEDSLYVNASAFTPVDNTFMTTGEIRPVEGTPMDFRTPARLGDGIAADDEQIHNANGYDHNWVLDTKGDITVAALRHWCPETGICLEMYTDEPGVQIYAGNFLDGTVKGKGGVAYPFRSAICFESQHYPDSPNKSDWPSVVLRPGETYRSHTIYAFSLCERL